MFFITATNKSGDTTRCFGYFPTYDQALVAVNENRGGMDECFYDYLVLEYIKPGIHAWYPDDEKQHWFEWNENFNKWVSCDCPKNFEMICNWAIG